MTDAVCRFLFGISDGRKMKWIANIGRGKAKMGRNERSLNNILIMKEKQP